MISRSGDVPTFGGGGLASAGVRTNAGAAADAVSTAAVYGELRRNSLSLMKSQLPLQRIVKRRISAMNAEANMAAAGIKQSQLSLKQKRKQRR